MMKKKYFSFILIFSLFISCVEKEEEIDYIGLDSSRFKQFVTDYLEPKSIIWLSDTTGKFVVDPINLLDISSGQVSVASKDLTIFSTKNNQKAAVLLDFGKEIQGGIQILAGIREKNTPLKMHVTLGESVSEAMSKIGEYGASNDHAMRSFDVDIPWLGTTEVGNTGFPT